MKVKISPFLPVLVGTIGIGLSVPSAGLAAQEAFDQEASNLQLEEVLRLAAERSPRLRAAQERAEATRAMEPGAGLLPDPTLQVGVMNLAVPEFSATMPASMAPSFQAMQRFPMGGKLGLRERMARQTTVIDSTSADETWWQVRTEAAGAFYRIFEVDRQLEVMRETLGLLRDFETIARAMYAAGSGRQADVLRANVEVARMEADIQRMATMRVGAVSRLNALLDQPADTRVPSPSLGPLPGIIPELDSLRTWAMESRPLLAGLRTELDRAGTRRELADKEIWPDLNVGLQYGFGRMNGDYKGMGGASVGFSLPIYAGSRQLKARDEAAAMESMVEARFDQTRAEVEARITETLADLDQARTLIRLYREEILPQGRAAVESSLSSYRVGTVDFMTLLDAEMALNRFQSEYYGLLASYGNGVAKLEMTIGRGLPVTDALLLEGS
jgi:outer membrane protein TolC